MDRANLVRSAALKVGADERECLALLKSEHKGDSLQKLVARCALMAFRHGDVGPEMLLALVLVTYREPVDWVLEAVDWRLAARDERKRELLLRLTHSWDEHAASLRELLLAPSNRGNWLRLAELIKFRGPVPRLASAIRTLVRWADYLEPSAALQERLASLERRDVVLGNGEPLTVFDDTLWTPGQRKLYLDGFFERPGQSVEVERGPLDVRALVQALLRLPDLCRLLNDAQLDLSGFPFFHDWAGAKESESWSALVRGSEGWLGAPLVLRMQVLQLVVQEMKSPCCSKVSENPFRGARKLIKMGTFLRVDLDPCTPYTNRALVTNVCAMASPDQLDLKSVELPGGRVTRLLVPRKHPAFLFPALREVLRPTWSHNEWMRCKLEDGVLSMPEEGWDFD